MVTSVVTDLTGRVLARASARVALFRPRRGWVEVDPLDWLAAAVVTVRRAVHNAGVWPQAVGLSGQMHGLVLIDTAGATVRPAILRPDARAVLQLAAYRDLPDPVRRHLGNPLSPAMAGPMLSWIAAHEPDTYARMRWALQPKDWLRAQLTGEFRTEPSDASATLLYDFVAETWSIEAVQRLGPDPGRLPEILFGAGHQAGLLTRAGADLIGLAPAIPVAAGAARTAAAALGAGLVEGSSAQVVLGPCPHVVTAIRALPEGLPLTGETHIYRAATDRGWCLTAPVADGRQQATRASGTPASGAGESDTDNPKVSSRPDHVRRLARNIATAVRSVNTLVPVAQLQVRATRDTPPGLLAHLGEMVELPVQAVNASDPGGPWCGAARWSRRRPVEGRSAAGAVPAIAAADR